MEMGRVALEPWPPRIRPRKKKKERERVALNEPRIPPANSGLCRDPCTWLETSEPNQKKRETFLFAWSMENKGNPKKARNKKGELILGKCRKTTFLLKRAFLHFHVSWLEGSRSPFATVLFGFGKPWATCLYRVNGSTAGEYIYHPIYKVILPISSKNPKEIKV